MDSEPEIKAAHFHKRISDLLEIYSESKEVIVLSEKFDPNNKLFISPLKDLRDAFDNIMRAAVIPDNLDVYFDEAESHIRLAVYNAYENLNINLINSHEKSFKKYNSNVIDLIFPRYYSEYIPLIRKIQQETAKIRANNNIITTDKKILYDYFLLSKQLLEYNNILPVTIPALEEQFRQSKKEKFREQVWYWSITILLTLLFLLLGIFYE